MIRVRSLLRFRVYLRCTGDENDVPSTRCVGSIPCVLPRSTYKRRGETHDAHEDGIFFLGPRFERQINACASEAAAVGLRNTNQRRRCLQNFCPPFPLKRRSAFEMPKKKGLNRTSS